MAPSERCPGRERQDLGGVRSPSWLPGRRWWAFSPSVASPSGRREALSARACRDGRRERVVRVFTVSLSLAFLAFVVGMALIRGRGASVRIVARDRGRGPAGPAGRSARTLDRCVVVLGLRPDRGGARREPVFRSTGGISTGIPPTPQMAGAWHRTTSVYGPAFTLASEPLALAARSSPSAAAWLFKGLGASAVLAATALAGHLARRKAFAIAFVGWNPLLAIDFGGGGHNDAWMSAVVLAALALAASGRRRLSAVAWAVAIFVKWVPLLLLPLHLLEQRARWRRVSYPALSGFAARRRRGREPCVRASLAPGSEPARAPRAPRFAIRDPTAGSRSAFLPGSCSR